MNMPEAGVTCLMSYLGLENRFQSTFEEKPKVAISVAYLPPTPEAQAVPMAKHTMLILSFSLQVLNS